MFRWFLARGVPIKDLQGTITHWFGTCTDIDGQKKAEEKQRFLALLAKEMRALAAPEEVTGIAMRLLGEHLRAARTTYNEVDEKNNRVTANRDYCIGAESILGTFSLSDFGPALVADLRAGFTVTIVDFAEDPRTAPFYESMYRSLGIQSFIAVPLIKDGGLVTILSVNMTSVRSWTVIEAEIVEEVAERTWLAVENARLYQAAQREIEERRRAEEHSNRLAAIVESSHDAIVSKDLNGIITFWNAAAERIYGYSAEEMIGKSKAIVIPPDLPDELANILDKIRRGEAIEHYETVRRRKDGVRINVSISVSAVKNASGQVIGASTIARDITERIRGEEERERLTKEVASQRKRLDDLISSVPGVVWEAWGEPDDKSQRMNFVSGHVEAMLGYTVDEWVSTPNFWLTIVHPDDREQAVRVAADAWISGNTHVNIFRWLTKDGRVLWCETHSVVIQDSEGVSIGMRGVTIDISDRKEAEAERDRSIAEIQVLNQRLKRSIQETHHRVKNNLQIISALTEIQMSDSEDSVPVTAMQRIGQHTRALAAIHDILTQQAKMEAQVATISTRAAMDKLIPLLQATIGNRQIRHQVDDVMLPVRSAASLALLVSELISNAVKHGKGDIEMSFRVKGEEAHLEICDDGPGFPPNFDWQNAASTGLALIDSAGRYDLHGAITFDNRATGGARAAVTFLLSDLRPD